MIVANSSPIIMLAKQGVLYLLKECFQKVIIPKGVYEEIMQKKESHEAISLEKAINDKWVIIEKINVMLVLDTRNISQAEKEAISLAAKHKSLLLIDDDSAKRYASIFGIEAHGTLYIIYLAYVKKFIDKPKALNLLENMIANGFYISAETYTKFLELLKSLKG